MSDLYDQRIADMKAVERCEGMIVIWLGDRRRDREVCARNTDRLAAYKRKRAALDGMMRGIDAALGSMGYERG